MAFVILIDVAQGSTFSITASRTYDWYSNHTTASHDYDKATRMQIMNNGNLWITGSTNFELGSPTNQSIFTAGTMNLEVDPYTLVPVANGYREFKSLQGLEEEGIALIEGDNESFIVGSSYYPISANGTYAPIEERSDFTVVTPNLDPLVQTYLSRIKRNVQGSNLGNWVQEATASPTLSGGIRLAGAHFENGEDYVTPYLADVKITTGLLQANMLINRWLDFPAFTGTATSSNSYFQLGGPLSHPLFQPGAGELNYNQGFYPPFLVNPDFYQYDLRPKIVREDLAPMGDCFIENSDPPFNYYGVVSNSIYIVTNNQDGDFSLYSVDYDVVPLQPNVYLTCGQYDPNLNPPPQGSGTPKVTSGIKNKYSGSDCNIYPNLATDKVQITSPSLSTNSGLIEVQLLDVQGRLLNKLYKGKASDMPANGLKLPEVAPGLYLLKINTSGTAPILKKLIIQ